MDRVLVRKELEGKVPDGKKVIADNIYVGLEHFIRRSNSLDSKAVSIFKARAKARQETLNGRLKFFKILSQRFRQHTDSKHKTAFEAVVVIVQLQMENGSPLFDPRPITDSANTDDDTDDKSNTDDDSTSNDSSNSS
jgi:hypothetical protein